MAARDGERGEGSRNGCIAGTYLHGSFASDGFRTAYLKAIGATTSDLNFAHEIEQALDGLSAHLAQHLDLDRILALAEPV